VIPATAEALATRLNGHAKTLDGAEWRARMVERLTIKVTGDLADITRASWSIAAGGESSAHRLPLRRPAGAPRT
jgi:hypothetical protein